MNEHISLLIQKSTGATSIDAGTIVQRLWGGYGSIVRYRLTGSSMQSVILKHISLPKQQRQSDIGHERKVHSYEVETAWYQQYADKCTSDCRVPRCLGSEKQANELWLLLEDLDTNGFARRCRGVSHTEIKACLSWLANFHALWMNTDPINLWPTGTYWHLATRPDELRQLRDADLRSAAPEIDRVLSDCPYQTLVHGDAKLDNFCFSQDGCKVAAVDFQYTGRGCGMKDLAYLVGCCFGDDDCEHNEKWCLDYYFAQFKDALASHHPEMNPDEVIHSWRAMYPVAWTDFHRFYKGWASGHWDKNSYSERTARKVIEHLKNAKQ